jgi:hypothetical protein
LGWFRRLTLRNLPGPIRSDYIGIMGDKLRELIGCHDCGGQVSFRAASCPHCGSPEPSGPYVFSRKEMRRHRIEQRNDINLLVTSLACAAVGGFYGAVASSGGVGAILHGFFYAALGLFVGVPIAFAINVTRGLLR